MYISCLHMLEVVAPSRKKELHWELPAIYYILYGDGPHSASAVARNKASILMAS